MTQRRFTVKIISLSPVRLLFNRPDSDLSLNWREELEKFINGMLDELEPDPRHRNWELKQIDLDFVYLQGEIVDI